MSVKLMTCTHMHTYNQLHTYVYTHAHTWRTHTGTYLHSGAHTYKQACTQTCSTQHPNMSAHTGERKGEVCRSCAGRKVRGTCRLGTFLRQR